jgi:hypothetical protein
VFSKTLSFTEYQVLKVVVPKVMYSALEARSREGKEGLSDELIGDSRGPERSRSMRLSIHRVNQPLDQRSTEVHIPITTYSRGCCAAAVCPSTVIVRLRLVPG